MRAIHGSSYRKCNVWTKLYTSIPLLVLRSFLHTQQMQEFPNALHVPRYNNKKEMTSKYSVTLEKRSIVLGHSQKVYMKESLKISIFNWTRSIFIRQWSLFKIISQLSWQNWVSRLKVCKVDLSKSPSVIIKTTKIHGAAIFQWH